MRKMLSALTLLLLLAAPARAQLTTPYTFTAGTVANPDEVNTNFAQFASALNRTGGTMTGTLTSLQITPGTTNLYDLGTSSFFYRTGYLKTSLVLGQTAGNYTLTWANPASARAISIEDPGGTDIFVWKAMAQTLTNKTLTAPVLSGSVTGTYTLAGTPTIPASGLTGTITLATQNLITSVGTLTGGLWNAAVIGLAYGGTRADLSLTGGTSQFLRQNTVGGNVTVVRPAMSDLSDSTTWAGNTSISSVGTVTTGTWSGLFGAVSGANLTTLTAANLSGTITSGTQDLITRLGTIVSGNWNGPKIGTAYGGTAIDASLSTGVPQVSAGTWSVSTTLPTAVQDNITRLGTLVAGATGAGFTVALSTSTITGSLADARLSANVPLLNVANAFTDATDSTTSTTGAIKTAGGMGIAKSVFVGGNINSVLDANLGNTASSASTYRIIQLVSGTTNGTIYAYSQGFTTSGLDIAASVHFGAFSAGGLTLDAQNATGIIRLATGAGGNIRWGVNAAGDWTFGASSHIADSNGTPTYSSGFGGSAFVTGADYAFTVSTGGTSSNGVVAFGHTWTNTPVCIVIDQSNLGGTMGITPSTTSVAWNYTSSLVNTVFYVLCRGY
jgi:hypothetical protein